VEPISSRPLARRASESGRPCPDVYLLAAGPGPQARIKHEYRRGGAWAYLAASDVRRTKLFGDDQGPAIRSGGALSGCASRLMGRGQRVFAPGGGRESPCRSSGNSIHADLSTYLKKLEAKVLSASLTAPTRLAA